MKTSELMSLLYIGVKDREDLAKQHLDRTVDRDTRLVLRTSITLLHEFGEILYNVSDLLQKRNE